MRPSKVFLATFILFCAVAASPAQTTRQSYRRYADAENPQGFSAGGYVALGFPSAGQPTGRFGGFEGQVGVYGEWRRGNFAYGLEGRVAGESLDDSFDDGCCLAGTASQNLIGPRLEYSVHAVHPYVEALFGSAHQTNTPLPGPAINGLTPEATNSGFGTMGAVGVDFDLHPHARFRVDYSVGGLTGQHGYLTQSVVFGYVLHF